MKKLSNGGKRDFKAELTGVKLLFFCFFFSSSLYSQIPINGFCSIKTLPVYSGYSRLMISDIKFDSLTDIVLYSPSLKKICVVEKDTESHYSKRNVIWSPNNFSQVLAVKNNETGSLQYAFISRSTRTAGYFDLSNSGRFNLIAELTFDSYPENISSANIDYRGNPEVLLSGSAFKGLSLLNFSDGILSESKIAENSSYGEAVFADISNDGYPDIAAFNLFNNELEILYNDVSGNFNKVRSLDTDGSIYQLSSFDINKDYYADLIYCSNNSINIVWGDFQSSYEFTSHLTTEYLPDRYSIADFNGDKFIDIAYIDTAQGLLSIFFSKGNNKFYPEVLYFKHENLVDLNYLKSDGNIELVLLNRNGEVYIISKIASIDDEQNLLPALKPAVISSFDFENNKTPDFCYIDEFTQTLNFVLNSTDNIPSFYFSVPVSNNHTEILVDDNHPYKKGFYCYSVGSNMLEIINYDFKNYNYKINQLYIPGKIRDVAIKNFEKLARIFVAFNGKGWLKVNEYEHHDFRYTVRGYPDIDENVIASLLSVNNDPKIFYWKAGADSLKQFCSEIHSGLAEKKLIGTISRNDVPGVTTILQAKLNEGQPLVISLLISDKTVFSVLSGNSILQIANSVINKNNFNINNEIKLRFEVNDGRIYNTIFYSGKNHQFYRLEIKNAGEELTYQELFKVEGVSGFIRQKFSNGNEFLLFTKILEGKISLKRLEY